MKITAYYTTVLLSLSACSLISPQPVESQSSNILENYDPTNQARVRIYWEKEDINGSRKSISFTDESGKTKKIGFRQPNFFGTLSVALGNTDQIETSLIGIPETKFSKSCSKNRDTKELCRMKEFIIPANTKILLGNTTSKVCADNLFGKCNNITLSHSFIAEAGEDYEILNIYHLYKIVDGEPVKEGFIYN